MSHQHFNRKLSAGNRYKSFFCAVNGLKVFFATQHNAWIEAVAAIIATSLGFYFHISECEWIALVFAITLVFISEIINTSIEYLTDLVSPNYHSLAGKVKDIAAAAVLFSCIFSLIVGIIIFYKYM